MNSGTFFLALLQLVLSLFLAVIVAYSTFAMMRYLLVKKYHIRLDNLAFAILSSSMLFSVGYIVSGIIRPLLNVIRTVYTQPNPSSDQLIQSIQYGFLFIALGFLIAFLVTILGLYLFTILTRTINEFEEISQDNRAIGLLTGVMIIVIAIFVQDSVVLLLESLIPYPNFPTRP